MLAFVPVTFDLYRTVRRHLHWTLQNLVGFADHDGKCWPSLRALVAATGRPLSTVGRHLAQLAADGIITRQRRPGGGYTYRIEARFLPAMRGESHERKQGVPRARTEENPGKKIRDDSIRGSLPAHLVIGRAGEQIPHHQNERGAGAKRYQKHNPPNQIPDDLHDDTPRWEARLRAWQKSRFWLPFWGPRPTEPGCWAPIAALKGLRHA